LNVVECLPLDSFDPDLAKATLTEAQQKLASAVSEQDKAVAKISVDTAEAIVKAISTK